MISRREAIKRLLQATAVMTLVGFDSASFAQALGADPDLGKKDTPWPLQLTAAEKRSLIVLADYIIPEDRFGPSASIVGVIPFIDEWLSAPYPPMQQDLTTIRKGLAWLDQTITAAFGEPFSRDPKEAYLHGIKSSWDQSTEGIAFLACLRRLVVGGYYTTKEGWAALGYTGNTPLTEFVVPSNALAHVKLQ